MGETVSWCFEPSQPQGITSGLNANFNLSPIHETRQDEADVGKGPRVDRTRGVMDSRGIPGTEITRVSVLVVRRLAPSTLRSPPVDSVIPLTPGGPRTQRDKPGQPISLIGSKQDRDRQINSVHPPLP